MGRTHVIAKRGIFEEVIVSKNLEMDCAQFVKKTKTRDKEKDSPTNVIRLL